MLATTLMNYKLLTIVIFLLVGCSLDQTVARVDSTEISASQLKQTLQLNRGKFDHNLVKLDENFKTYRRDTLSQLIQEAVLLNEAKRQKIITSNEEVQKAIKELKADSKEARKKLNKLKVEFNFWITQQAQRITLNKLLEKTLAEKMPVEDKAIEEHYNKNIHQFYLPTKFHARQILVNTDVLANQVHARLIQGEDFIKLAKEFSESPDREHGGDLGWFDAQSAPLKFSEICQELKEGEISSVKRTDYGYQIFQLIKKQPSRQKTLTETKNIIIDKIRGDKARSTIDTWIKTLAAQANIFIDEKVLAEVTIE